VESDLRAAFVEIRVAGDGLEFGPEKERYEQLVTDARDIDLGGGPGDVHSREAAVEVGDHGWRLP
jgi:hypothetical protein